MADLPDFMKPRRQASSMPHDQCERWHDDVNAAFDEYKAHRPLPSELLTEDQRREILGQMNAFSSTRIRLPADYVFRDASQATGHRPPEDFKPATLTLDDFNTRIMEPMVERQLQRECNDLLKPNPFIDDYTRNVISLTRWQKFKNRWSEFGCRLCDAFAVLIGRKQAIDWDY